jgi:NitT/TauT family transport system substrate-binding protein
MKIRGLIATIAVACAASLASAADLVRVALPAKGQIFYAPVYVAKELGYYAENGVEVDIIIFRGGGPVQEALVAKSADVGSLIPFGVAQAVKNGVDQKIIAGGPDTSAVGWHLLVPKESPVKSVADLKGKKIAISSKNSTTDTYAVWANHKYKLNALTVPLGGGGLAALKSGQVDAIVLAPAVAIRMLLNGEMRSLVHFGDAMEPTVPMCWTAMTSVVKEKGKALAGFLNAVQKASAYMKANKEYTLKFLRSYSEEKDERYLKEALAIIDRLSTDGRMDPTALANTYAIATLAGLKDLPGPERIVFDVGAKPQSVAK